MSAHSQSHRVCTRSSAPARDRPASRAVEGAFSRAGKLASKTRSRYSPAGRATRFLSAHARAGNAICRMLQCKLIWTLRNPIAPRLFGPTLADPAHGSMHAHCDRPRARLAPDCSSELNFTQDAVKDPDPQYAVERNKLASKIFQKRQYRSYVDRFAPCVSNQIQKCVYYRKFQTSSLRICYCFKKEKTRLRTQDV